jgi:alcohol dehydrogenase (cytochrome c)
MNRILQAVTIGAALSIGSGVQALDTSQVLAPIADARLLAGTKDTSGWLMYGGNYENWRYSPLDKINRSNVKKLAAKWLFQTGIPGQFSGSPIVADGVLYVTAAYNNLYALDARSGEPLWHYEHEMPSDIRICCGPVNRGVAIAGNRVFMATLDARLMAFDRATGTVAWNIKMDDYKVGYSATSAPLVIGNKVISGIAGGEYGARGFIDAYDVETGKRIWRRYSIPGAGERGVETWAGDSWKTGGGPTWVTGSYDPHTNLLYWPTGNPSPDWNGDSRAGDNLYSNSVLALDPETGDLKWHFQYTPHDVWDYDATNGLVIDDLEIFGETVRAVIQPNRNGYAYALDAKSGKFLAGSQYTDRLNWSKGLDENGRPIVDPTRVPRAEGGTEMICPGNVGGNNGAYTYAWNPQHKLMYVPVIESCATMLKEAAVFVQGTPFWGGGPGTTEGETGVAYGTLVAIDPATGDIRWKYRDDLPMIGGALATAGGLIFSGNQKGYALALDDATGEVLWKFQTGSSIRSQPVTWEMDGRQYVAIPSGGGGIAAGIVGEPEITTMGNTLVVFALPE